MTRRLVLLTGLLFAASTPRAQVLADFLDPSFGANGLVASAHPGTPLDVSADGAGRIVAAAIDTGPEAGYHVARYRSDGALDSSFGLGGLVSLPFPDAVLDPDDLNPLTVGLSSDGRIIIATRRATGSRRGGLVFALNEDGSRDLGFGMGGWLLFEESVSDLKVSPDGRILLALQSESVAAPDIVRLLPSGSPDPTFGANGLVDLSGIVPNFRAEVIAAFGGLDGVIRLAGTERIEQAHPALIELSARGVFNPDFSFWGIAVDSARVADQIADVAPDIYRRNTLLFRGDALGISRLYSIPDPEFGMQGYVGIGQEGAVPRALVQLAEGSLLAAGTSTLALLQPDGSPNALFGASGWLASGWNALAVQPDTRIVLVGGSSSAWTLARIDLHPIPGRDALVSGFGSGGVARINAGGMDWPGVTLERPDGRLLTFGRSFVGSVSDTLTGALTIVQTLSDGRPDRSFGEAGRVEIWPESGAFFFPGGAFFQSDGRILVTGVESVDNEWGLVFFRFESDGSLDPTFGSDGIVRHDFTDSYNTMSNVVLQPDGGFLGVMRIGGTGLDATCALVRFEADGTLDRTFGADGIGPSFPLDTPSSLVQLGDGQFLIAGNLKAVPTLLRLQPDGTLDAGFGTLGVASLDLESAGFSGLVVRDDGRITASTWRNSVGSASVLAQFLPDGRLDPDFGDEGVTEIAMADPNAYPFSATKPMLLPDGGLLVAGQGFSPGSYPAALSYFAFVSRFTPNGMADQTFGTEGHLLLNLSPGQDVGLGLQLLADGRVLLTGAAGLGNSDVVLVKIAPGLGGVATETPTAQPNPAFEVYPNPAEGTVSIRFSVDARGASDLEVYDLLGRRVARLAGAELEPGTHTVQWSAADLPNGLYLLRLRTPERTESRRLVITR